MTFAVAPPGGALVFHALPAPSGDEVAGVAAWTHAALLGVLERHGGRGARRDRRRIPLRL